MNMRIATYGIGGLAALAGFASGTGWLVIAGVAIIAVAIMVDLWLRGNKAETSLSRSGGSASATARIVVDTQHSKRKSDHVIRTKQFSVPGFNKIWLDDVKVAGVTQAEYAETTNSFILNGNDDNRAIILERDPDNKYDPNAIKVIGKWKVGGQERTGQLSWIEADVAAEMVATDPELNFAAVARTLFAPRPGYSAGIRLRILCKYGVERSSRYRERE